MIPDRDLHLRQILPLAHPPILHRHSDADSFQTLRSRQYRHRLDRDSDRLRLLLQNHLPGLGSLLAQEFLQELPCAEFHPEVFSPAPQLLLQR